MNKLCKSKSDGKLCSNNSLRYIGMNFQKNHLQIAVRDKRVKIIKNIKIDNNIQMIEELFDQFNNKKIDENLYYSQKIVIESSYVWYHIYECLSEEKIDVIVLNPINTIESAIKLSFSSLSKFDPLKNKELK